jgi:hypothetical protein
MIYYFQYSNGGKYIHTDVAPTSGDSPFLQFSKDPARHYRRKLCWISPWETCCATNRHSAHTYGNVLKAKMEEVV